MAGCHGQCGIWLSHGPWPMHDPWPAPRTHHAWWRGRIRGGFCPQFGRLALSKRSAGCTSRIDSEKRRAGRWEPQPHTDAFTMRSCACFMSDGEKSLSSQFCIRFAKPQELNPEGLGEFLPPGLNPQVPSGFSGKVLGRPSFHRFRRTTSVLNQSDTARTLLQCFCEGRMPHYTSHQSSYCPLQICGLPLDGAEL